MRAVGIEPDAGDMFHIPKVLASAPGTGRCRYPVQVFYPRANQGVKPDQIARTMNRRKVGVLGAAASEV